MVKARKQIVKPVGPQKSEKPKSTYNIWYNKYAGDRPKSGEQREKASTRCNIAKDAGETRGTHLDGAGICLNFARGCCPLGFECSWLHVIPDAKFNLEQQITRDCFGRERHAEVRDDQSGVGSFNADDETSRTLYIGGIAHTSNMNAIMYKHFSEWGEIENVRVLESKGVAFVRYKHRSNAEFALEAMQRQSLDNNEILNARWATNDPNPWVEKRKRATDERKLLDVVGHDMLNTRLAPKRHQGYISGHISGAVGFYPNTDNQYAQEGNTGYYRPDDNQCNTEGDVSTYNQYGSEGNINSYSPGVNQYVNTVQSEHHQANVQPQTLSELIAWSQKQAALNKMKPGVKDVQWPKIKGDERQETKEVAGTSSSLVGDYDSSSDDGD